MVGRTARSKVATPVRIKPKREITPRKPRAAASVDDTDTLRLPFEVPVVDGEYITPRGFLRSALFGVTKKGERTRYESEPLAAVGGFRITYTGEALNQSDYDVWMHMVHRAHEHGMGPKVIFTLRSFLEGLSWDLSGKSMTRLREIFDRLFDAVVIIEFGKRRFKGHLVDAIYDGGDGADEAGDQRYYFRLSPEMAAFFTEEQAAYVAIQDRKNVRGMMAKWLHAYILADTSNQPASIDQLRALSRSSAARRSTFVASLRQALEELAACGIIEPGYRLDANYVYYRRIMRRAVSA
jgi:hypothetical protein